MMIWQQWIYGCLKASLQLIRAKLTLSHLGWKSHSELIWNEIKLQQPWYGRNLGVWLYKDLDYLKQLRVMKNKCIKFISLFYLTEKYLSTSMLINILKTYGQHINQFGCLLYGKASRSHLGATQRQQNCLTRIILGWNEVAKLQHFEKIFHALKIWVSFIRVA